VDEAPDEAAIAMARPAPLQRAIAGAVRVGLLAHSSPRARRVFPVAAAFRLADPYAAWARRTGSPRWERFRRFQKRLLEYTPLAGSEDEIAQRQVAEMFRCIELYWRPWLMARGGIQGIEHFHAARSRGRGVVAVFTHFGLPYAQFPIMPRCGIEAWAVVGSYHFQDLGNGYIGRFARQGRAYFEQLGPGRTILSGGAFEPALELLRDGATVTLAFDLVGRMPTPFLGRTVSLASGASRLAYEADAVVAPFFVPRVGERPMLRFATPIDSREHSDAVSVQAAIAKVMERWALELPEAVWPLEHNGTPLIRGPAPEAEGVAGRA
jgi:lauroyl/myristoyl acyltransferase